MSMITTDNSHLPFCHDAGWLRWGRVHPGMDRLHVIPRNKYFNIYLHRFRGPDQDRDLHDHPWWSFSWCLRGQLWERCEIVKVRSRPVLWPPSKWGWRRLGPGSITTMRRIPRFVLRRPGDKHSIIDGSWMPAMADGAIVLPITLFITGPKVRVWGFHTKDGFVEHNKYWDYIQGRDQ